MSATPDARELNEMMRWLGPEAGVATLAGAGALACCLALTTSFVTPAARQMLRTPAGD